MPYKYNPFTGTFDDTTVATVASAPSGTAAAPGIAFTGDTNTGIYSPGADQLAIATGGTGRITVDASGNVNIDSNTLYVDAVNNRVGVAIAVPTDVLDTAAGNYRGITIKCGTTAHRPTLSFFNTADSLAAYIQATGSSLAFGTMGTDYGGHTETFRIDSSNRLLVGTIASPAYQLQVSTDSAGKPSSALWTIVSDERIKEDIELADLDLCYEAIKAIPLKRYKWRDDIYTAEQVTDRRKLGWIAQDVEAIFPKAVGTHEFKYNQVFEETIISAIEEVLDDDGNVITPAQPERIEQGNLISEDVIEDCRDLNSDQIYAAMYGAVQKLMAKVEALEIKVSQLQSQ